MVERDSGMSLYPMPFTAWTQRMRTAIDNLETTAKAERDYSGSVMERWVEVLRDVLNAFRMIDAGRQEQIRALTEATQATTYAEAEIARAQAEMRSRVIEAVSERVAAQVQDTLLLRIKGRKRTEVLYAVLLFTALLASLAYNGYNRSALSRCLDLSRQRQVGLYGTAEAGSDLGEGKASPTLRVVGSAGWPL
jgi:hypothetical protein